jgi:hypothetical protein
MAYSNKMTVQLRAGRNPKTKEPPHEAFANMQDSPVAGWAFYDRWGALYDESLVTPEQAASARADQLPCPYGGLELRDNLRSAWRGDERALAFIERSAGAYMKFSWVFRAGRAELVAEDLWSAICVLFLRDRAAHKTAICENPDCPNPHFIRKRKTQKFCEAGPCVEYGARLRANKWWQAHGTEWRDRHRKKSSKGRK